MGIPHVVQHTGAEKYMPKDEFFKRTKTFYASLIPAMEKTGVSVLTENGSYAGAGAHRYGPNSGKDIRELVEYVGHPLLNVCWDIGHANCEGNQYDEIMALGDELFAIHYNDNHGMKDDHVAPFLGRLNHDEVIHALIDVNFKGYFTLECDSSLVKYDQWTGNRRRFEGDSRLREPQLFMQRHIEAMMYDTSKWMLETYGLFEK
jgi:sugar phosphate isomerase/epimerase